MNYSHKDNLGSNHIVCYSLLLMKTRGVRISKILVRCHRAIPLTDPQTYENTPLYHRSVTKHAKLRSFYISWWVLSNFYRKAKGLWSRNSVRLSVCHTRALRQNQTMHCGYFDTTQRGNHSCVLTPTVVGGRRPLPSKICAQSDPPLWKTPALNGLSIAELLVRHDAPCNIWKERSPEFVSQSSNAYSC